jgi:hypothetical protein
MHVSKDSMWWRECKNLEFRRHLNQTWVIYSHVFNSKTMHCPAACAARRYPPRPYPTACSFQKRWSPWSRLQTTTMPARFPEESITVCDVSMCIHMLIRAPQASFTIHRSSYPIPHVSCMLHCMIPGATHGYVRWATAYLVGQALYTELLDK